MTRGQKELEFFLSQDKYRRMVDDDTFFDVKEEEIKRLLKAMTFARCEREEIVKIRKKYHPMLHDAEAEFMNRLGLNYDDHIITKDINNQRFYVNGYSESEWRMLVDDEYFPTHHAVKLMIARLQKRGDNEAVQILNMKYSTYFTERAEQILASHNIPLDTPYSTLTTISIDGITFNLWHLLYDPQYIPSRHILVSQLHFLRKEEKYSEVKVIEDKYKPILGPNGTQITEAEFQKAKDYFEHFLD